MYAALLTDLFSYVWNSHAQYMLELSALLSSSLFLFVFYFIWGYYEMVLGYDKQIHELKCVV